MSSPMWGWDNLLVSERFFERVLPENTIQDVHTCRRNWFVTNQLYKDLSLFGGKSVHALETKHLLVAYRNREYLPDNFFARERLFPTTIEPTPLNQGLANTVKWYKENDYL